MSRKSRKNVGLIGLGIIGSRVAAGLRGAGFQVFVWNRSPKAAPNFVGSPAEVAGLCEIIQLFVSDAQALFEVIEQMSEALTARHLVICNATVGPEATLEAARLVEARGAAFLDAPFTGSKLAAERRELVYYLGGDDASCLRARPVLEATSRAVLRIGDIGHAATIKVVTNMIAAVSTQTLAEALAIVQKAGLDPEVLSTALEHNACRSATMEMKLPMMIAGEYEPHFSLKHMFKDVQLGIHVANALDIEIPATTVTAGVMYGALNAGCGELDFSALYKVYEPQVKTAPAALRAATAAQLAERERDENVGDLGATPEAEKRTEAPRLGAVLDGPAPAEVPEKKVDDANPAAEKAASVPDVPRPVEPAPSVAAASVETAEKKAGADEAAPGPAALSVNAAPTEVGGEKRLEDAPPNPSSDKPIPLELVLTAADETPGDRSGQLVSATSRQDEPKTGPNGNADEQVSTGRPLNFVRRWFVSRGS